MSMYNFYLQLFTKNQMILAANLLIYYSIIII